jgi:hypothetical protein
MRTAVSDGLEFEIFSKTSDVVFEVLVNLNFLISKLAKLSDPKPKVQNAALNTPIENRIYSKR